MTPAPCSKRQWSRSGPAMTWPGGWAMEFAQSGLMYAEGGFRGALQMVETALRTGLRTSDDTRGHLTYQWRCDLLTMLDRLDESLEMSAEGVASAQRDRQGWACEHLRDRARTELLQMGRLADAAAALEGQLTVEMAPQIVSVLDATGVVALGSRRYTHGRSGPVPAGPGDGPSDARPDRSRASVVTPPRARVAGNVSRRRGRAHEWLCALGEEERMGIVPLFPMDVADEARLIHIALAAQDDNSRPMPRTRPSAGRGAIRRSDPSRRPRPTQAAS